MFASLGRHGTLARRSRRKVALAVLVAVIVTIVIGEVINDVVKSSAPAARQSTSTWIAAIGPIVADSDGLGASLQALQRTPVAALDRAHLDATLTTLSTGSVADVARLAAVGLPAPSGPAESLLAQVLSDRQLAVSHLVGAIETATGGAVGRVHHAAIAIAAAGNELSLADVTYRRFRAALPAADRRLTPDPAPIGGLAAWSPPAATAWMSALASTPTLAAHRTLALVAISLTIPGSPTGQAVVAISGLPVNTAPSTTATTTTTTTTTTTLPRTSTSVANSTTSTTTTTTTTTLAPTTTTLQIPPAEAVSRVQPTSSFQVDVVVKNTGTMSLASATVAASVAVVGTPPAHPPGLASSAHRALGAMAPEGSRFVVLAPIGVVRGHNYVLTVVASTPGAAPVTRTLNLQVAS